MYSQLSGTQQAVLSTGDCPHCAKHGHMREVQTRNGPTVRCDWCGKKVYRPRGRGAPRFAGMSQAQTNEVEREQDSQQEKANKESGGESGRPTGGLPSEQGKASQAASQAIGKPLSQAASDAISKIEAALRQEMQSALQEAKKQAQGEVEKKKQELEENLADEVAAQVQALKPKEVIVKRQEASGETSTVTIPQAHPLLAEVLRRIAAGLMNFLLVGPSGSGKTTLVRQVAEALGLPYSVTPWSAGLTEGGVLGRLTPDGQYLASSYVLAFEQASVHNWDEIDAADPNVPLCANSGIENGEIFLPARIGNPRAVRHAQAYLFATANTWGVGADMMFVGRNQMDAAFRSRFAGGMFFCDYSTDLELQLVPEQDYLQTFWEIRAKVQEHKLRRIWGTRELVRGATLLRHGYQMPEVFTVLTTGFSPDEKQKMGVA